MSGAPRFANGANGRQSGLELSSRGRANERASPVRQRLAVRLEDPGFGDG